MTRPSVIDAADSVRLRLLSRLLQCVGGVAAWAICFILYEIWGQQKDMTAMLTESTVNIVQLKEQQQTTSRDIQKMAKDVETLQSALWTHQTRDH